MLRGRVLPGKFEKFHNWAKPSPRFNPATVRHSTSIDRSCITSGCSRSRDSVMSLGRLRQLQYGLGAQVSVVGVELNGVSQA